MDHVAQGVGVAERDRSRSLREEVSRAELRAFGRNSCPAQLSGRVAYEAEGMAGIHANDAHARGQASKGEALAGIRLARLLHVLPRRHVVVDECTGRPAASADVREPLHVVGNDVHEHEASLAWRFRSELMTSTSPDLTPPDQ